jgi:hypothetical protein
MIDMVDKMLSGDRAVYEGRIPGDEPFQPDLILHMGMTSFPGFGFETCAHRDGYLEPGQDGVYYPTKMTEKGGR